ncbi:MAG: Pvc16 family protein [Nitrospira sp.]|nr:Pvc16 family protein [Nitrospira sp.]
MIRDLSLTLKKILEDPNLPEPLKTARVVFDHPAAPFAPTQLTVDVFLYDIRENLELRSNEPIIERNNGQATMVRSPKRVACSYLITAWPVGGEEPALQEQRILSQVLMALSQYPTIPASLLQGSLVGQEPPLPMVTAQPDGLKDPHEFWAAIGNHLRPSITVTVTIAMQPFTLVTAPLVMTEVVHVGERTSLEAEEIKPATRLEFFSISGRVTDATGGPVTDATIVVVESNMATTTDVDGRYHIRMMRAGAYTLRVQKDAAIKQVGITVPASAQSNYDVRLT